MDLHQLFAQLGPGFGLVKALNAVSRSLTDSRSQLGQGMIDHHASFQMEQRVLSNLIAYSNDVEWARVLELKQSGQTDEAMRVAQEIRSRHGLGGGE